MKKFVTFVLTAAMAVSAFSVNVFAAPATAKAVLSNAKIAVNGTAVEFQAYNIGGNNYFKLRDVAVAVNGTVANFEVGYDKDTKAITLTKGTAYTGSKEAATATAGDKTAKLSTQVVVLDGAKADLTAYNIDGYNYFKLRDLGTALGFEVTWDSEAKLIGIAADAVSSGGEDTQSQEENGRSKATEFTFKLAAEEERIVENLVFDEDVTISGDFGTIVFENCEFNGDIINAAEQFTKVILPDGTTVNGNCVFKNTIKEATMDTSMPKFVSPNTLNIVCEDCIGACILDGTEDNIIFNGETYSMADVEFFYDANTNELVPYEGQEASALFVGQWWENGEKILQMFCE